MYHEKINDFEIRVFLDVNNDLHCRVNYCNKKVETRLLKDHFSNQYIGYYLISSDLKSVLSWAELSLNILNEYNISDKSKLLLNSLFMSMLVTYWKCFADTKGRHGVQLNNKFIDPKLIFIHEEIKRLRHNYVAHCGDDPFENGFLVFIEDNRKKNRFDPVAFPIQKKARNGDKQFVENIISIVTYISNKVEAKQEQLMRKILEKHIQKTR